MSTAHQYQNVQRSMEHSVRQLISSGSRRHESSAILYIIPYALSRTCQALPNRLRFRMAYSALSPPLRKLNRSTASPPVPSDVGVPGRDGGADFIGEERGSAVPQISHAVSSGWFRKVHAGHAISFGPLPEADGGEEDRRCAEGGGGADTARGGVGVAESTLERGTPQSAHLAPVGLEPGGLRKSHTSHCQLSPASSPSVVAGVSGVRYSVIFADDVKSPA
jgi:hypothetical protein